MKCHRGWNAIDAFDRDGKVLRVRAGRDESIIPVPSFRATIIPAKCVSSCQTVQAKTTTLVRSPSNPSADLQINHVVTQYDNLAGPFVPGSERVRGDHMPANSLRTISRSLPQMAMQCTRQSASVATTVGTGTVRISNLSGNELV